MSAPHMKAAAHPIVTLLSQHQLTALDVLSPELQTLKKLVSQQNLHNCGLKFTKS